MTTLIEKSILNERLEKSRSGIYTDTSENRRKHRVGQKYGSEKKEEEKPEKTDLNKMSPEQQLEAINKVIAAVNEGKLKLPPEEINTLVAKKTMAEEAVKQAKGEKKPEKKEEPKKGATKPEEKSEGKQYASMDIKEAKKESEQKELSEKVERLISEKKKKFPNPDIESPMSDEEKRLTKEIADTWSEINKLIQENRKSKEESKSEPKQGETEESYTRVKFDDVPNSGKVNLKKYLSDKVRNQADENLGVLSKVSFENLQTMEKGLVKEFNSQFGSLSKSRRAEKLYSIMKVKSELENRKQEESKKYQKYTSSLDDNTLLSIGYDLGEEIRKLSSRGFSTLEQQQEVLKKISELSVKRQINEDEQRKRMDKLNNSPDETRANKKGELTKRGNESQKKE